MDIVPGKLDLEVIPGILEQEWPAIEEKLTQAKLFAKTVHVDLLDGIFAPNKTFMDPAPFAKYAKVQPDGKPGLKLEIHMMVENPVKYLESFADAGFTRFIGQIEKMPDIIDFVAKAEEFGEVGLALDSDTPMEKIKANLSDLDFAFVMTVKAGFSNQSFLPEMLKKVEALRVAHEWIPIEVDGGINDTNILQAKIVGATRFVSTGFIFNNGESPKNQYDRLCKIVTS